MAFTEDKIPACRCTAHPAHEDLRRYMKVVKQTEDHVVWYCQRCTEISKVPTIQVQVTPRGRAVAAYANREYEAEKRATLGTGKRPRVGRVAVTEEKDA